MSSVSPTTPMTMRPLHPRFGLEVRGFDLREIDAAAIDQIRREIERHGLVVFRNQLLDDDELVAFGRKVGDGRMEESARNVSLAADRRLVAYLTNLKDETGHGLGFGGADTDYWHSDQEFRRAPATLASLYCLIPSPKGGATSFATTAVEHLDLPAGLLEQLRSLRSTRRPAPTHDNAEHIEVSHPVIMTSPILGKDLLYVSENLIRFVGLAADESARLKRSLLARILDPANVYSHAWRMGDLIVYDNTQLLHRREAFEGIRWLKATKIFAPRAFFAVPQGEVLSETVV